MFVTIRKVAGAATLVALIVAGNTASAATAGDKIRVLSNVCAWEDLDWEDMNPAEQRAWAALGWNQQMWDGEGSKEPGSSFKDWDELSYDEAKAAYALGFNYGEWERDCP